MRMAGSMAQHHHMKPAWARALRSKRQPKEAKFQRKAILLQKQKVKRCKKKLFHPVQMYEKTEGFTDRVEFCMAHDRLIFVDNHNLAFSCGFRASFYRYVGYVGDRQDLA